jgi:tight adherence protein B
MNILSVLAALSAAVVVFLLATAGWLLNRYLQDQRQQELSRRLEGGGTASPDAFSLLIKNESSQSNDGLDALLRQAGSPYSLSTLRSWIIGAGLVGLLFGVLLLRHPIGIIGGAFALLPLLALRLQASGRVRKISEQLPDALDLISRSLQAGHGLSEAIRMAAEESSDPIGSEFARVYDENNLGRDLRECLQNLLKRTPGCFDLQIFVSSVLLQRDTGGNLVEILKNISATVRARFLFEGKLRALTSEAKFTAWVLGSLPFFVTTLISIRNPDYLMPLLTDTLGNVLVLACVGMFSMGVFLMYDFSKVEV